MSSISFLAIASFESRAKTTNYSAISAWPPATMIQEVKQWKSSRVKKESGRWKWKLSKYINYSFIDFYYTFLNNGYDWGGYHSDELDFLVFGWHADEW